MPMDNSGNNMVVGFVFSPDMNYVVLIEKQKPEWQFGLLNGVGGKAEPTDSSVYETMTRECFEETGLLIDEKHWTMVIDMVFMEKQRRVVFFFCNYPGYAEAMSKTEEKVGIYIVESVTHDAYKNKVIPNLKWIIPLCQNWESALNGNRPKRVIVDMREVK